MKFKIPFTIFPLEKQVKTSKGFARFIKHKRNSKLQEYLDSSNIDVTREQYLGVVLKCLVKTSIILFLLTTTILLVIRINRFYIFSIMLTIMFSGFVFFSQMMYPRIFARKREREIEKNLLPALEDMLVQLNSGIPLFTMMVNISSSDYGELSDEFKKAVKRINAGIPAAEVIDDLGRKNSSVFFKRTLWQISNGLRAGSDMTIVIRDSIKSLNEEQVIQIQNYGNKLNPLIMFYMLSSVIIPALSITFLTVLSSMIGNMGENTIMGLFAILFVFVVLMQVMFLGAIKSSRPNLL
jgi:flagellar protein FlaJ